MKSTLFTLMLLLLCPALILRADDGGDGNGNGNIKPPDNTGGGPAKNLSRQRVSITLSDGIFATITFAYPEGEAELTLVPDNQTEPSVLSFDTSVPFTLVLPSSETRYTYIINTDSGHTYTGRLE